MIRQFAFYLLFGLICPLICKGYISINDSIPRFKITKEQNQKLFQNLYQTTLAREAQSPFKNKNLQLDLAKDLQKVEKDFLVAKTLADLFYAMAKFSNARRNQHLLIKPFHNGITITDLKNNSDSDTQDNHAAVQFEIDYQNPDAPVVFLSAWGKNSPMAKKCTLGDLLLQINDKPLEQYLTQLDPYLNYSTKASRWQVIKGLLPRKSLLIPPHLYAPSLKLEFLGQNQEKYEVELNYQNPKSIEWENPLNSIPYPDFELQKSFAAFSVLRSTVYPNTLLLQWHNFGPSIRRDIDQLMVYAFTNQLLTANLIIDIRHSEGGQHAPYAIQRLVSKPFRITTGNVKKSDIFPDFCKKLTKEGADDRLVDWLETEQLRDTNWTKSVSFKLQYHAADMDPILSPADLHFKGKIVLWCSPASGSQVDQFSSTLIDNQLAYAIGMKTGGYSNTWEWKELLYYPNSDQALVYFPWSIGNTFRPNGEILEGNPPNVDLFFPPTRHNYDQYSSLLLQRSLAWLMQN